MIGGPLAMLTAENVSLGIWISALGGSWLFAASAVVAALCNRPRRLVRALRHATIACVVETLGLAMMVLIDNPERWKAWPWLLSLMPFGLALAGVVLAFSRGDVRPGVESAE